MNFSFIYTFICKGKLINPKYLLFGLEVDQSIQMQKKMKKNVPKIRIIA